MSTYEQERRLAQTALTMFALGIFIGCVIASHITRRNCEQELLNGKWSVQTNITTSTTTNIFIKKQFDE